MLFIAQNTATFVFIETSAERTHDCIKAMFEQFTLCIGLELLEEVTDTYDQPNW